jgi:hypothetical protein
MMKTEANTMKYEIGTVAMKKNFMVILWAVDANGCKSVVDAQDNVTTKQYPNVIQFFQSNADILNSKEAQ